MYQKTVERTSNKRDLVRIRKVFEEARSDPEFRSFIREFIKAHTGSK